MHANRLMPNVYRKKLLAFTIKEKYGKAVEQNERYKYIVSLLMSNDEVKKAFGI